MKKTMGIVFVCAGLLSLTACGKKEEEKDSERLGEIIVNNMMEREIKKNGGGGNVEFGNGELKIKDAEGNTFEFKAEGGIDIPKDFPKDVHVPKNIKISQKIKSNDNYMLIFSTKESVDGLRKIYQDKMKAEGWTEEMSMTQAGMTMLQFRKDEREASIALQTQGGETVATVNAEL
jgi:major membrane immunogen (membrane-anchored lipoprotein)